MDALFSIEELKSTKIAAPFEFTKGVPVMKIEMNPDVNPTGIDCVANWEHGSCLFDLAEDPGQTSPIDDPMVMTRLLKCLVDHLVLHDAPEEIYAHYGLQEYQSASAA